MHFLQFHTLLGKKHAHIHPVIPCFLHRIRNFSAAPPNITNYYLDSGFFFLYNSLHNVYLNVFLNFKIFYSRIGEERKDL